MKATSAALRPFSAFRAGEWRSWLGIPFRRRQALEVRGGTGKMDEAKLIGDLIQRFGMAEKEITGRLKAGEKVLDDAALGGDVEIDEDIAAEDEIHALHEEHLAVVVEIEAGEVDAAAHFVVDAEFFVFGGREIFALVEIAGVAQGVAAVDAVPGGFDGAVVEIGGLDFEGPAFEEFFALFEQEHREGVGFLAGGTAGTPDFEFLETDLAARGDELGEYD